MPFKDPKKNKEYMQEYGRKARKNMPSIIKALELELSEEKLDEYYQDYKHKIKSLRNNDNKYNTTHISYKDGVLVKNEQPFKN